MARLKHNGTLDPTLIPTVTGRYSIDNADNLLRLLYKHAKKVTDRGGSPSKLGSPSASLTLGGLTLATAPSGSRLELLDRSSRTGAGVEDGPSLSPSQLMSFHYHGDKFGTQGTYEGSLVYQSRLRQNASKVVLKKWPAGHGPEAESDLVSAEGSSYLDSAVRAEARGIMMCVRGGGRS
jgi:hypothetical protein